MQKILFNMRLVLILLACVGSLFTITGIAEDKLDFNREVRPILAAACFRCHGFDASKREADLRLDTVEGALKGRGDEPPAIVSGDPDSSLVMRRILSEVPDESMPPPSAQRQLTQAEKDIIRKWIVEGAEYKQHWSFEAIKNAEAPVADSNAADGTKTTIDRFLIAEMKRKKLLPQPMADRRTLIRRVAFTLTGLPPTLSEQTEFVMDKSEQAYERMVDRYLDSPRYGEEMARHWLDVARYGDTHGLHLDNERQMWAYRDWVVRAFNENLPFSQFTIEQLAGDLLPSPTQSQLIATGFNRCNVTTSEGGAIAEEFLYRYAVDRTSTVIQTWLGLTGGCAVCHDHKYDPLTTKDFYSLYAFFYSAADPAMDGNINTTAPFQSLQTPDQERELARCIAMEEGTRKALFDIAEKTIPESIKLIVPEKDDESQDNSVQDNPAEASSSLDSKRNEPKNPVTDVWLDDEIPIGATQRNTTRNAEQWNGADRLEIPMGSRALYQGFGNKFEQSVKSPLIPFALPQEPTIDVWVRLDRTEPPESIFIEISAGKKTKRFGWAATDEQVKLVGVEEKNRLGDLPRPGEWCQLHVDLSAFEFESGARLEEFKLGQFGGVCWWDGLRCNGTQRSEQDLRLDVNAWAESQKGKTTPYTDKKVADTLKKGVALETAKNRLDKIAVYFHAMIAAEPSPEVDEARRQWTRSRVELEAFRSQIPGTFVYKDTAKPRQAYTMKRGQYDQKGDSVDPATPTFLPPMVVETPGERDTSSSRPTRLDLARWLVSESHPLPARVAVNRFWQQVFGIGLVRTSEDFGSQGALPTHPELLDHLAFRFRDKGWNVKQLMKELVMTAAFRQTTNIRQEYRDIDPDNLYLSRGPRIRLDAEQIRDNVLAVSGLLELAMGGPGAKGYQPSGIWEPVGYGDSNTRYYLQDHGRSLYRRSLYCFIKRTAPPPFMSNFDAPNREMFCTRRERSNTPLQALQLMNDVQHFEAARRLAERILRESGESVDQRIQYAFQVVLARSPDSTELTIIRETFNKFLMRMNENPSDAAQMIRVGESIPSSTFDRPELAAYTLLANLILNLDEAVVRN